MSIHSSLRRSYPYLTPPFAGDTGDERRKSLSDLMQRSITRPESTPTTPVNKPVLHPELDPNTGANLSAELGVKDQPMPRVHVGVTTKGLQGVDKSIAELQAARDYDREGLGFKVRPDMVEMTPPDPHIDWKDRLKAAGKTALISIANIRRSNPDASIAEMLAGGATGAAIGGISPNTGNAMLRREQLGDMERRLAPQIAIEQERAQLEDMRQKPLREAAKVQREDEYRREQQTIQRELEAGRMTRHEADLKLRDLQRIEAERHNREQERLGQARVDKPPTQKPDTSDFDNANIQQSIAEAQAEKKKIADALKDTAEFVVVRTYSDGSTDKEPNPIYKDLKMRDRALDDDIRGWRQKLKAPISGSPRNTVRGDKTWSQSKWQTANPNGDAAAAIKAAQAKGYRVVE